METKSSPRDDTEDVVVIGKSENNQDSDIPNEKSYNPTVVVVDGHELLLASDSSCNFSLKHVGQEDTAGGTLSVEIVEGATCRGRAKLIDSLGYSYTEHKTTSKSTVWRCSKRNNTVTCKAKILQKGEKYTLCPPEHCHPPPTSNEGAAVVRAKVLAKIRTEARTRPFDSAADIVKEALTEQVESGVMPSNLPHPATLRRKIRNQRKSSKFLEDLPSSKGRSGKRKLLVDFSDEHTIYKTRKGFKSGNDVRSFEKKKDHMRSEFKYDHEEDSFDRDMGGAYSSDNESDDGSDCPPIGNNRRNAYKTTFRSRVQHDEVDGLSLTRALGELIREQRRGRRFLEDHLKKQSSEEDLFFSNCALRLKKLPPATTSILKLQISQLFFNAENPDLVQLPITPLPQRKNTEN